MKFVKKYILGLWIVFFFQLISGTATPVQANDPPTPTPTSPSEPTIESLRLLRDRVMTQARLREAATTNIHVYYRQLDRWKKRVKKDERITNPTDPNENGKSRKLVENANGFFLESDVLPAIPTPPSPLVKENAIYVYGKEIRFENQNPIWNQGRFPEGSIHSISVSNGKESAQLYPNGMGPDNLPHALIYKDGTLEELKSIALIPIWLTFRGLNEKFNPYPINEVVFTGQTKNVAGVLCYEGLIQRQPENKIYLYFDLTGKYLVRQIRKEFQKEGTNQPKLSQIMDITYDKDPVLDLVPKSWTWQQFDVKTGTPIGQIAVDVSQISIRPSVEDNLFQLQLKAGSHIHDVRVNRSYLLQKDEIYPSNSDEGIKPLPVEDPKNLEDKEKPIGDPGQIWFEQNRYWIFAIVFSIVCIVVYRIRKG